MQRLDLSETAPCCYDVGVEFVDPPPALRELIAQGGSRLAQMKRQPELPPSIIRDRRYEPRLEREGNHALPWHLVVLVDSSPCFSGRYATKQEAMVAWTRFKRQHAQPKARAAESERTSRSD
jgi:hypothetical protein